MRIRRWNAARLCAERSRSRWRRTRVRVWQIPTPQMNKPHLAVRLATSYRVFDSARRGAANRMARRVVDPRDMLTAGARPGASHETPRDRGSRVRLERTVSAARGSDLVRGIRVVLHDIDATTGRMGGPEREKNRQRRPTHPISDHHRTPPFRQPLHFAAFAAKPTSAPARIPACLHRHRVPWPEGPDASASAIDPSPTVLTGAGRPVAAPDGRCRPHEPDARLKCASRTHRCH